MNAAEATEAVKAIPYPRRAPGKTKAEHEENLLKRAEYHKATALIEAQFKAWLGAEYAGDFRQDVKDAIWDKAWQDGHAYGYANVESEYSDLADFARTIYSAM